jgi:hypothetical protein
MRPSNTSKMKAAGASAAAQRNCASDWLAM